MSGSFDNSAHQSINMTVGGVAAALGFVFGSILQLVNCLSPTINRPLRLALHDRRAFTVVVQAGTGLDPEHPESGSMANSTLGGRPGDGRSDTPHGGSR